MLQRFSIVFCFIFSNLIAQPTLPAYNNKPFKAGEKLYYEVEYSFFDAAKGYIHVNEQLKNYESKVCYWFTAYGYTSGFFDKIIRMRDRYDAFADTADLRPYVYRDDILEGSYRRKGFSLFDHDSLKVTSRKGVFNIPKGTVDVLTVFYQMRNFNVDSFNMDSIYSADCFLENEVFKVAVKYVGNEVLDTDHGYIECMRFSPIIPAGDIFEEQENAHLWITNDKNKIPVRAAASIVIGSIKMDLSGWEGLKYPFTSLQQKE